MASDLHFRKCHSLTKGNSWIRNSLRKLVKLGLLKMKGTRSGLYFRPWSSVEASSKAEGTTADERDLTASFQSIVETALKRGVHPGDVLSIAAAGYCGLAKGLGLSLEQATNVVESWWDGEPVTGSDKATRR